MKEWNMKRVAKGIHRHYLNKWFGMHLRAYIEHYDKINNLDFQGES